MPAAGFSLDLDSTVFQRSGNQEGAKRGYNPSRPGRFTSPKVGVVSKSINRCWTTFHNGQEQLRRSCRPSHLVSRKIQIVG
jgi:hypothetical protein